MAVQKVNDPEFLELIKNNSNVIVKYYADWCGSCRLFSPNYNRMSEDEKNQNVLFLDVNAEENPEARKMAGVSNLPFFAVFQNGKLLKGDSTSKPELVESMIASLQ